MNPFKRPRAVAPPPPTPSPNHPQQQPNPLAGPKKLAIIVPFADADLDDNQWSQFTRKQTSEEDVDLMFRRYSRRATYTRREQLDIFLEYMQKFLENIPHVLLVQIQSATSVRTYRFNRGLLLNLGFMEAERHGCDVVCFHDVDLLPPPAFRTLYTTIPHAQPSHLGLLFPRYEQLAQYFGGVLLMTTAQLRAAGGFPNEVWGWGYEDSSLLHRYRKVATYERSRDPAFQFFNQHRHARYVDLEYLPDYLVKNETLRQQQAKCPIYHELRDRELQGGYAVFDTLPQAADHAFLLQSSSWGKGAFARLWRLFPQEENPTDVFPSI